METITSVNNARVKDVANLKQKKFRTERCAFFAEGLRAVTEAVRYGDVTDLFFTRSEEGRLDEILKTAEEKGAEKAPSPCFYVYAACSRSSSSLYFSCSSS